jgi:hypothetical protein
MRRPRRSVVESGNGGFIVGGKVDRRVVVGVERVREKMGRACGCVGVGGLLRCVPSLFRGGRRRRSDEGMMKWPAQKRSTKARHALWRGPPPGTSRGSLLWEAVEAPRPKWLASQPCTVEATHKADWPA